MKIEKEFEIEIEFFAEACKLTKELSPGCRPENSPTVFKIACDILTRRLTREEANQIFSLAKILQKPTGDYSSEQIRAAIRYAYKVFMEEKR